MQELLEFVFVREYEQAEACLHFMEKWWVGESFLAFVALCTSACHTIQLVILQEIESWICGQVCTKCYWK